VLWALDYDRTDEWNHGLGEIVTAVLGAGQTITGAGRTPERAVGALPGRMTRLDGDEWQLSDRPERLPHTYTLQAVRAAV